jgi:DNA mismatch endonuclease, patch repair protein
MTFGMLRKRDRVLIAYGTRGPGPATLTHMPVKKNALSVPRFENYRPRTAQASRVGTGNRRQDTTPEILLRAALRAAGVRYRSNVKTLPGCPDLVLVRDRIVVFCDGDFWHGRHWAKRKSKLLTGWNAAYWVPKIERNRARDRSVAYALRRLGWRVVRVWEGDVRRDPVRVAAKVVKLVAPHLVRGPSRKSRTGLNRGSRQSRSPAKRRRGDAEP